MGSRNAGDSFMENFDPNNMTKKQHDFMLAQVYDGYNTKTSDVWTMEGAGSGRAKRKTGTRETFDPQSYNDNDAWSAVAKAANISNINNKTDVAQMYQFIEDANNRKELDKRFADLDQQAPAEEESTDKEPVVYMEPAYQEAKDRAKGFEDMRNNSNTNPFEAERDKITKTAINKFTESF